MSHPYLYHVIGLAMALAMPLAQLTCVNLDTPNPGGAGGNTPGATDVTKVPPTDLFLVTQAQGWPVSVIRDAQLQVALLWNTTADLDLTIREPNGFEISGKQNLSSPFSGGQVTQTDDYFFGPEEIVYQAVPEGNYEIFVEYVSPNDGITGPPPPVTDVRPFVAIDEPLDDTGGTGASGDTGATGGGGTGEVAPPVTEWDVRIIFNGKVYYMEGTLESTGERDHVATVRSTGPSS